MFEKLRIKEHMEVTDANGGHLGTVDELDGDTIKLTRSDSTDGVHHYIPFDSVDRIEDNRVYLKSGAPAPAARQAEQFHASGTQQPFTSGSGAINPDEYSTQRPSAANPNAESPLFGSGSKGAGSESGIGH